MCRPRIKPIGLVWLGVAGCKTGEQAGAHKRLLETEARLLAVQADIDVGDGEELLALLIKARDADLVADKVEKLVAPMMPLIVEPAAGAGMRKRIEQEVR